MTKVAYSYLRFSTPEQLKGDSLRRQTALAEDYAKRHGLKLDTELNLKDLGVSAYRGANLATGALGAFLQAIRDKLVLPGSYLLVESLDRVSRKQARKAVRILEEIVEAGVTVVTLNDGKAYTEDSLDGTDFLIAIIVLMRAHEESLTKSKRLKAAWSAKRERLQRGERLTKMVPSWFQVNDDRTVKLIPERAKVVRRIFSLFLEGRGKEVIAQTLNTDKVPTWRQSCGRPASDQWRKTYVYRILKNPAVTGRFVPYVEHYDGDGQFSRQAQAPIEDYFPRVIDDETFSRVQMLLESRRKTVRRGGVQSIVAGLARCPVCGGTMTRIYKVNGDGRRGVARLVCVRAKNHAGCIYKGVPLPSVEQALTRNASRLRTPPSGNDLTASIAGGRSGLTEIDAAIENLLSMAERSPSKAIRDKLARRESERERVAEQIGKLEAQAAESSSDILKLRTSRLADALTKFAKQPQHVALANSALRECVESVTVNYRMGVLELKWRHGPTTQLLYAPPEAWS